MMTLLNIELPASRTSWQTNRIQMSAKWTYDSTKHGQRII